MEQPARFTRFIFVRHAKSMASELGIVQGTGLEVPLTDLGHEQAHILVSKLASEPFDLLFASTALRARDTALPLRSVRPEVPYAEIADLRERSKGVAEGTPKTDFDKRYPEITEAWAREEDPRPEGGESFEDVEHRALPVLDAHLREYRGKTVVYIIHGNVIRVLLGAMLGIPYGKRARIAQDYCGLSSALFDHERGRWCVEVVNKPTV
ncbi:MAG: histidine phosphatase family protein [Patescibacteria group bacterium]